MPLKTNICDERVCSKETSGTALIPEHSYPHCAAKWGATNRFENFKYCRGPKFLFACPLHPPHPHSIKQGTGTAFGDQRIVTLVFGPQTTIIINVRLKVSLTFFSTKFKLQPLMQTFFFPYKFLFLSATKDQHHCHLRLFTESTFLLASLDDMFWTQDLQTWSREERSSSQLQLEVHVYITLLNGTFVSHEFVIGPLIMIWGIIHTNTEMSHLEMINWELQCSHRPTHWEPQRH